MIAVNDIYATVQGEGCQTGMPMVIVRLHGCDVGCPFCDTKETWEHDTKNLTGSIRDALGTNPNWAWATPGEIVDFVFERWKMLTWILLTGGEPGDQYVGHLIDGFHEAGYKVAIETSGTAKAFLEGTLPDWICVSPKIGMPGGRVVDPMVMRLAHEVKHVVGKPADLAKLDALLQSCGMGSMAAGVQICLQPMSESKKATDLCMATCLERGWRLSIQTHKLIGAR